MASNRQNKGSVAFEDTIREYLENVQRMTHFSLSNSSNPSKSVEDCVTYIINEVQKSGCNGFADDEIFGMAIHYYEENEIEVGKPINCQMVVNHTVELTEEEKEQARQDAIERLRQEEMAKTAQAYPTQESHRKETPRCSTQSF